MSKSKTPMFPLLPIDVTNVFGWYCDETSSPLINTSLTKLLNTPSELLMYVNNEGEYTSRVVCNIPNSHLRFGAETSYCKPHLVDLAKERFAETGDEYEFLNHVVSITASKAHSYLNDLATGKEEMPVCECCEAEAAA